LIPHDPHARSDFDQGPARQRKRFTNSPSYISFTGIARTDLFPLFKAFYHNKINDGADWFTAKVWDGDTYTTRTVRFREPYKASDNTAKAVSISFSLEMKPAYLTDSTYNALLAAEAARIAAEAATRASRETANHTAELATLALAASRKATEAAIRATRNSANHTAELATLALAAARKAAEAAMEAARDAANATAEAAIQALIASRHAMEAAEKAARDAANALAEAEIAALIAAARAEYLSEQAARDAANALAEAELLELTAEAKAAAIAKRAAEIIEAWEKWLRLLFVRVTYGDQNFYDWTLTIHHSVNAAEFDPVSFQDSMGLIIPLYN
jgi:hypothetical protein